MLNGANAFLQPRGSSKFAITIIIIIIVIIIIILIILLLLIIITTAVLVFLTDSKNNVDSRM